MAKQSKHVKEILAQLEALGDANVRKRNANSGAGENYFGVPLGELRKVAKKLKTNAELGAELWETGNLDACLLAVLLIPPKTLPAKELDRIVRTARVAWLADWVNAYLARNHPEKEALREAWMQDADPWAARAGWSLTAERIAKSPEGLDLPGLLDRIESEMATADPAAQWTMNNCLAGIGIHHAKLRKRALAIGEKLGIYRDYPCSKGCTSPFAPVWIAEMVRRAG